mmetsp:Transcript_30562/g.69024  ORF Transcript_30562/g.69024 Transcript_30562/m.69024 type:complete len:453 (+) Transcript_30562:168-1526(+)
MKPRPSTQSSCSLPSRALLLGGLVTLFILSTRLCSQPAPNLRSAESNPGRRLNLIDPKTVTNKVPPPTTGLEEQVEMTSVATADQNNEVFASFRQNMGGDIFQQQNEGDLRQQLLFMEHQQDFMLKQNEKMQAQLAELKNLVDLDKPGPGPRNKCQIVYILGVEGATHHGFMPILEALATEQVDELDVPFHVEPESHPLKAGILGWYPTIYKRLGIGRNPVPPIDDPALVEQIAELMCPNDGRHHVIIEWASFPSGQEDDKRPYRFHRQHSWLSMSVDDIANSGEANNHPINLPAFYRAYSLYADVKFVVIHRPYLSTIASHAEWDTGPVVHSRIIWAYLVILNRFLGKHMYDMNNNRIWELVCVQVLSAQSHGTADELQGARSRVIEHLANFLGWPNTECQSCFDQWKESTKDPAAVLGDNYDAVIGHKNELEKIWPPKIGDETPEQQCGI